MTVSSSAFLLRLGEEDSFGSPASRFAGLNYRHRFLHLICHLRTRMLATVPYIPPLFAHSTTSINC